MKLVYEKSLVIVSSSSLLVFLVLFFLFKVSVKPVSYFLITLLIIALEINLLDFIFKKDLLFFRRHIKYEKNKVWNEYFRFLCLIGDITLFFLLILFVFFNSVYYKIIYFFGKERNSINGGIKFFALSIICGSVIFGMYFTLKKIFKNR